MLTNSLLVGKSGKFLLNYILTNPTSKTPFQLAEEMKLIALSSTSDSHLRLLCEEAVKALPKEVAAFRAGNENAINRIIGYVMKQSRGRADPRAVTNLVKEITLHGRR